MNVQNGDYRNEKVFTGNLDQLLCAICGERASSLHAMSWAKYRGTLPFEPPDGFAFHAGSCASGEFLDLSPRDTGPDWQDYLICELIDEQELARRRSRLDLEELRPVYSVSLRDDDSNELRHVLILQGRHDRHAYCLASDDEAYIRLISPETNDDFERAILGILGLRSGAKR